MKRLTEAGIRTGTDKATYHQFTEFYDDIFKQYESPRILEIGIDSGNSIKMYYEYFKNPYIVAMDINPPAQINTAKFIRGDQSNINDLLKCVDGEEPFDIVLDDGGHFMNQQQITFGFLFNYVKSGGYFVMEDIHTSFRSEWLSNTGFTYTTYDMLKKIERNELEFSNYIDIETQKCILSKIDSIDFWWRTPDNFLDSGTCVIKVK